MPERKIKEKGRNSEKYTHTNAHTATRTDRNIFGTQNDIEREEERKRKKRNIK